MAFSDHDVGLLTSSAQIFASNHTLPQIRAIHKALHVQIDDKAARLRTQVGGSYRELLGTADTIVQMRGDMDDVQTTLAGMGTRCGRAVVGGKVAALAAFGDHAQAQSPLSLAARARLLEACTRTVGRLLARPRRGGGEDEPAQHEKKKSWGERLVLAAKVLVLGRLLLSSVGETAASSTTESDGTGPKTRRKRYGTAAAAAGDGAALHASIAASKKALGSLRRRLQDIVDLVERAVPTAVPHEESSTNGGEDGTAAKTVAAAAVAGREDLLRALCAHSLTTTSGVRDVLWHLLHVRSQAMAQAFDLADASHGGEEEEEETAGSGDDAARKRDSVLRGLALYTMTLLDVQALLPHRLPDALLALKKRALLDDAALRGLEGLPLDVYARWAGDDVQYFQPYLRHDDLDAAQARAMLAKWADRGAEVLVAGLQRALEDGEAAKTTGAAHHHHHPLDLLAIVDLRTRVLQLWIRDSSRARGLDPAALLDQMRAVFNRQLLHVLEAKAAKLRLVGAEVAAALASMASDGGDVSGHQTPLWAAVRVASEGDESTDADRVIPRLNTDLSDGAVPFVRDVVARLHGRSDAVARAAAAYATWRRVVDDAAAAVQQLRRQRWDNDADDMVEDEDTIAARQQRLSRDDPQTLRDQLQAALATALRDLDAQITAAWEAVADTAEANAAAEKGRAAVYLIRVLREIRSAPPAALDGLDGHASASLGLRIIPALHTAVARAIVAAPLDQFVGTALGRTTVAGRLLWDSSSSSSNTDTEHGGGAAVALPASPSPGVFQFLRDLSAAMGQAGMDLWSPAAVTELRRLVVGALAEKWTALLQTAAHLQPKQESEEGEEGEDDDDGGSVSDDQRRDLLLQWLFDLAWLRCSLAPADVDGEALSRLEELVYERLGLVKGEQTPRPRIAKAAQAYWKKTRLLFGLLA